MNAYVTVYAITCASVCATKCVCATVHMPTCVTKYAWQCVYTIAHTSTCDMRQSIYVTARKCMQLHAYKCERDRRVPSQVCLGDKVAWGGRMPVVEPGDSGRGLGPKRANKGQGQASYKHPKPLYFNH